MEADDPHRDQPVLRRGPAAGAARLGAILIHGRGASAQDILTVADEIDCRDIAVVAPQAAGRTWYPHSFLTPIEQNEPNLTSALAVIARLIAEFGEQSVPPERIAIVGFSQGACLSLEFVARHARRYAAVGGLSGGLIGPPGTPRTYDGSLDGTPILLGCSDVDSHIPLARVHESADVFRRLGAIVDERIYPGMGHTINQDELDGLRALLVASPLAR
jgi:predicted esterase